MFICTWRQFWIITVALKTSELCHTFKGLTHYFHTSIFLSNPFKNMKACFVFSTFTSRAVSLLATCQTCVFLHMFTFLPSKVKTTQTRCEFVPFNLNPSWLSRAFLMAHPKVMFKSKGITALNPNNGRGWGGSGDNTSGQYYTLDTTGGRSSTEMKKKGIQTK